MDSKFNIGDLVFFEGVLYEVRSSHYLNPQLLSDPFVCGLVPYGHSGAYPKQIMVREGLLVKDNSKDAVKAIKVLYGK